MKRFFSAVVVYLIFALLLTNLVFADDAINVRVENKLITQGDKNVSVSINISNNPGIALLTFNVKYDSTVMNLVSVDNGNLFPNDSITLGNMAKNPYTVLMLNASKNSTRNGTLITLNFNIKNGNLTNKYDIILSRAEAYNIDDEPITVYLENGSVVISEKEKLDLLGISFPSKAFTYDGTEKSISINGNLPVGANAKVVYENQKAIDAGKYNVKATITADGYNDLVLNSTMTINPKELTVSNIKVANKTYDGTTRATITGGSISGIVKGDNVTAVFPTSGIFASANVGTDILVSVDDVALNGADKSNYNVSQITNLKADITQAPVSISSINIDEKTAILTGVLKSDKQVELDFEQIKLDIGNIIDGETSKVTFTNFVLKGDKSNNYAVVTDKVEGTIKTNNLVSIKVSATNGIVTGAGTYTKGSMVTVKATPNSGYEFKRWTVSGKSVSTNATYSFVIDENMELVAEFAKKASEDGGSGGGGGSAGGSGGGGGSAGGGGGASGAVTKPVEKPKEDVNENNEEIKDDTSNNDVGTNTKPMNFTDVKENDWYYDAVSFAYEKGITSGTSESSFSPNDKVTRGQFITMLCRAYGISEMSGENFSDAGNTWYTGYLAAAKQLGISNGVGGNKFEPEKNITREEMVTLIYNYLKSIGEVEKTNSTTDFVDEGSISSWADESVAYAYSNGIVSGKGNNVFDPKGNATRAELAQIFFNMLK